MNKFGGALGSANDGGDIRWPDVIPGFEVWGTTLSEQPDLEMAEGFQIGAVWNSISVIVAHS